MLDNNDFIKIGANVRNNYRTHTFTKGLDVNNKKFKKYTPEYRIYKAKGNNFRQDAAFANKTSPVFTGDLLRDFGTTDVIASNTGFKMGWSVYGARVESLVKGKRLLTTKEKALPNGVAKFLDKQVDMAIKKKLGPDTTTTHRIKK